MGVHSPLLQRVLCLSIRHVDRRKLAVRTTGRHWRVRRAEALPRPTKLQPCRLGTLSVPNNSIRESRAHTTCPTYEALRRAASSALFRSLRNKWRGYVLNRFVAALRAGGMSGFMFGEMFGMFESLATLLATVLVSRHSAPP